MTQFFMRVRCWMNSSNQDDYLHRRFETSRGVGFTMAIERLLTGSIRERGKTLSPEDLIIESFKDIVKDELKAHIRNKIGDLLHAKSRKQSLITSTKKRRLSFAEWRLSSNRLGLRLLPDELQGEVEKPLSAFLRKNWAMLLDKAL